VPGEAPVEQEHDGSATPTASAWSRVRNSVVVVASLGRVQTSARISARSSGSSWENGTSSSSSLGASTKRAGERDALLLGAGQFPDPSGAELHPLQHRLHTGCDVPPGHTMHPQPEPDVLCHVQMREQRGFWNTSDTGAPLGRDGEQRGAVEDDLAPVGREQTGQHCQVVPCRSPTGRATR